MEMRELTDALGETRVNRRDRCEKETPVRLHPACEKSSQLLSLPRRQQQKHQDQQQHSVSVTFVGYGGVQTGAVEPAAAKTAQATQRCGHYIGHGYVVTDKSDAYAQWPMAPLGGGDDSRNILHRRSVSSQEPAIRPTKCKYGINTIYHANIIP